MQLPSLMKKKRENPKLQFTESLTSLCSAPLLIKQSLLIPQLTRDPSLGKLYNGLSLKE